MIRIEQVTFKNFKVFGNNPYTIQFSNSQLVLLDGPNGYGKTSVFDAIELALTGNISRLITLENRQNPSDIVVAHEGSNDVEITISLTDDIRNLRVFKRRLKSVLANDAKRISKFAELWELYELIEEEWQSVPRNTLESLFGSSSFARNFLLFNYIQQEETARFLKSKNETERARELSQLFGDTKSAEAKLEHIENIAKRIDTKKKIASTKLQAISTTQNIAEFQNQREEDQVNHFFLLPSLANTVTAPEWDEKSFHELSQEKFNLFIIELYNLKSFVEHKDYFLRERRLIRASQEKDVLRLFVKFYKSLTRLETYKEQLRQYSTVQRLLLSLKGAIPSQIKSDELQTLFEYLGLNGLDEFTSANSELAEEEAKNTGIKSLYADLLKHHEGICEKIEGLDEKICPLCGHDHHSKTILELEIAKHGVFLRSMLSSQEIKLVEKRNIFIAHHLNPLIDRAEDYLRHAIYPSAEEITQLEQAVNAAERLQKLARWLTSESILYESLLVNSLPEGKDEIVVEDSIDFIIEEILSRAGEPSEGYLEANEGKTFERVFKEYFLGDASQIRVEILEAIPNKERFLRSAYYNSQIAVVAEYEGLKKLDLKLEAALKEINEVSAVIKSELSQFRKKLITDIEIPFYIYSGKILQTHQAGIGQGVFVKDPTGGLELKNVRLVANWKSDHDILNTMSSGQISAVVIALTLALNKVYCKNFSNILIDDPVQTMDDINMSSLVELIRNDFSDKDIILSTHEEKVARYFTYKFLKYGKSVKRVNIMERREYVPNNKYVYSDLSHNAATSGPREQ